MRVIAASASGRAGPESFSGSGVRGTSTPMMRAASLKAAVRGLSGCEADPEPSSPPSPPRGPALRCSSAFLCGRANGKVTVSGGALDSAQWTPSNAQAANVAQARAGAGYLRTRLQRLVVLLRRQGGGLPILRGGGRSKRHPEEDRPHLAAELGGLGQGAEAGEKETRRHATRVGEGRGAAEG